MNIKTTYLTTIPIMCIIYIMRYVNIFLQVTEFERAKIKSLAVAKDITMQQLIRSATNKYIKDENEKTKIEKF
jgi:ABC-type transport system involved in Fe-S cluster assembly fused permease/ATPase subunit